MDTTLKRLRQICDRYRDCAPDYYLEPILESKTNNARRVLRIPSDETIVALIDLTLFGSAKDAIVVTERGLYWKFIEDPQHSSWSELKQQMFSQDGAFITFSNKKIIGLLGSSKLGDGDNRSVFNLIRDLQEFADGSRQDSRGGIHTGSTDGFVVCEFCGQGIKPEVTYCKFCGIKIRG